MKDIRDYEGLYAITEDGQVWSHRRQKFLKPSTSKDGYLRAGLHKDGKLRTIEIHRLVAEAYIPNPDNLPQVNHKSEIKTENFVGNLEWCSSKYNMNYGSRIQRAVAKCKKPVYCVELNKAFESIKQAAEELGVHAQSISACLNGRQKTTGGYHFKYHEGE